MPINKLLAIDDGDAELYSYKLFLGKESEGLIDALSTADMIEQAEHLLTTSPVENRPEIIVLDGNMPGRDPLDFIQFLIQSNYTGELLICTDSDFKAKKMIDSIENSPSPVRFQYTDTKFYDDKKNHMKGHFILEYLKSRNTLAEIN